MKKIAEASKSEDQLNEAMRQARRERNEAEKLMKEEEIKEDEKEGTKGCCHCYS